MGSRPHNIPAVDLGAQSGHETQFLCSEGDVRDSDPDFVNRPLLGEFFYPCIPLRICEKTVRPFLLQYLHSLDFLDASKLEEVALGQQVPYAELSGMSRVVDSLAFCQWTLAIQGGSPSFHRVLSDNRVNEHRFIVCREFTEEVFLQCYFKAHQEFFGMLEMTFMVHFLMLRLRGALQQP